MNMATMKLGKRPVQRDSRTLRLSRYISGVPAPPSRRAWDAGVAAWKMMLNDTLGCCVIAAQGHATQLVTANVLGVPQMVTVPDSAILSGYEQVGGYKPGQPNTDQGCDMLTALKWWQHTGIGGHTIAAYAACSLTQADIEACINLFGFCYIGFAVPQSAMDQIDRGQPWDVVANDGGIVGGHCVDLVDYDEAGPTCITWGQLQKMTWAFFERYCSAQGGEGEAYGVVTHEWIAANGQSPSGLDLQTLLTDVQQLTQNPDPIPDPTPQPTPTPVVDPAVSAWLDWQATVADYVRTAYEGGDAADARTWQGTLDQYETGITALVTGQHAPRAHKLPRAVPVKPA